MGTDIPGRTVTEPAWLWSLKSGMTHGWLKLALLRILPGVVALFPEKLLTDLQLLYRTDCGNVSNAKSSPRQAERQAE